MICEPIPSAFPPFAFLPPAGIPAHADRLPHRRPVGAIPTAAPARRSAHGAPQGSRLVFDETVREELP